MTKCTKYEGLFTFADEATLLAHISECEDCRLEHEKMLKISALIGEVKPHFETKRSRLGIVKAACITFVVFFSGMSFGYINQNYDLIDNIQYGQSLTVEDLGFPTDNYGLIMVDQ